MSHHHSYSHRGSRAVQPFVSLFKYDTSGTYSHIKWKPDGTVLDESNDYPYGIYRWYVCDRWRSVYEHDAHGTAVAGDLDELRELVPPIGPRRQIESLLTQLAITYLTT